MRATLFATLSASLLLGACASTPGNQLKAEQDPLEPFNRRVYDFNKGMDKLFIKPVTVVYRTATPAAARRGASNALDNVDEPLTFINALLQGKPKIAANAVGRFVVNTVLGVGGLADHATDLGLEKQKEDFGQTLAVWGMNSGPYLMLPLFGPATFRDTLGLGVDFVSDPYRISQREIGMTGRERLSLTGLEVIDLRSRLMDTVDDLVRDSADEYALVRSAYLQNRQSLITDGVEDEPETPLPVLEENSEQAPAAMPADAPAVSPATDTSVTQPPATQP